MLTRALLLVGLLASYAAAERVKPPACGPPKQNAPRPKSVRAVDWCNFGELGGFKGKLREGRSTVHLYADLGQPHDTIAVSLRGIVFGDLDGDKRAEAAIVLEHSTWNGRTGDHTGSTGVQIWGFANGAPVKLGSLPAGSPVEAITLAKGVVTITSGPATARTTMHFRRDKDEFVELKP